MTTLNAIVRQFLLFSHTLAFAFAIVMVLRANVELLTARRADADKLNTAGRLITRLLILLWVTGLGLLVLDIGTDLAALAARPMLVVKVVVVTLLTINGVLLQRVAFPMMTRRQRDRRRAATVCTGLGAVGTVTWLYAAFVGGARLVAPLMSYFDFMALYIFSLVAGWLVAVELVRPRIERQMKRHEPQARIEQALFAVFGRAASVLMDRPTRRAHAGRPWAYAHALAARIPAGMAKDRAAFLKRIQPLLGAHV